MSHPTHSLPQFSAATKKSGSEQTFGFFFVMLSIVSVLATTLAPSKPDALFIAGILSIVFVTLTLLFMAKQIQPKPVNWLTADVLFAISFCLIHFAYFAYWIIGATGHSKELWYFGHAPCPHTVSRGLAMYAAVVNSFLAGYYLLRTRRWIGKINEQKPAKSVQKKWGNLGRLMVRLGCACFCAFIIIFGPAQFFGHYSGTNNVSFIANIFYQVGQVFLMSGVAISMASRQRLIKRVKRKHRFSLGVSALDAFLIAGLCAAIGVHGDRSTLLYLIGAFVVSYSEFVKPIPLKKLIVAGLVLVFFLGFIIAFRAAKTETYDFDPLTNINAALLNMGTSSVCGFVAIDYTDTNGFTNGWMQVKQLAGIIPFGRRLFGLGDTVENSSSMLLTLLIQGTRGEGVAGTGTSVFADLYFDFGLSGCIIYFFTIGMLAKSVQNRARTSTSILTQVILVTLVAFLAVCSRYSFTGGLIRTVLYSGIYTGFVFFCLGVPTRYRLQNMPAFSNRMTR